MIDWLPLLLFSCLKLVTAQCCYEVLGKRDNQIIMTEVKNFFAMVGWEEIRRFSCEISATKLKFWENRRGEKVARSGEKMRYGEI